MVDDNADVRGSLAAVLRSAGYAVTEAPGGFAALEHLRSAPVDAIVLDVFMPGLSGLELLDMIDDPPPVALLTVFEDDPEVVARRDKVATHLQKPVAPRELLRAVAALFARP